MSYASNTNRRACAMPDLPPGRAFSKPLLRALGCGAAEAPLQPVAKALTRSGMAHALARLGQ